MLSSRIREGLLSRHFLWRFLEHDLVAPNSDRHNVLSALAGGLVAGSLFVTVLVAWPYQLFAGMPAGTASIRALDDRFLFVSTSMLIMALAAVAQWDALVLDARDAAVLGPLPIPHRLLVTSKFLATGVLALAVLAGWNAAPTVLRGAAVPAGLRLGWLDTGFLTVAHGLVTCAAGLFGFLTVLAVRESLRAVLGPDKFKRVSALLQAVCLVLVLASLLLLLRPGGASHVGARWSAQRYGAARMVPPLWFVGLHEVIAGSVLDQAPRVRMRPYMVREDEAATMLYRGLRPEFYAATSTAVAALFTVAVVAIVACLLNSRRLGLSAHHSPTGRGALSRLWNRLGCALAGTRPIRRAGFFLAAQATWRGPSQRMTMAGASATALTLLLVATISTSRIAGEASVPLGLLAGQYLALAAMVTGFRQSTRMPADLRGSTGLQLAWQELPEPFISGVRLAGWVTVLVPTLTLLAGWHSQSFGLNVAVRHLGVGAAAANLMLVTAFCRNRRVPLVSVHAPQGDPTIKGVLLGAAILGGSLVLAAVEKALLGSFSFCFALVAALLAAAEALKRLDRAAPAAIIELSVSEQDALPTQRLGLSG